MIIVDSLTLLLSGEDEDSFPRGGTKLRCARERYLYRIIHILRRLSDLCLGAPVLYAAHMVAKDVPKPNEPAILVENVDYSLGIALGKHWPCVCDERWFLHMEFGENRRMTREVKAWNSAGREITLTMFADTGLPLAGLMVGALSLKGKKKAADVGEQGKEEEEEAKKGDGE